MIRSCERSWVTTYEDGVALEGYMMHDAPALFKDLFAVDLLARATSEEPLPAPCPPPAAREGLLLEASTPKAAGTPRPGGSAAAALLVTLLGAAAVIVAAVVGAVVALHARRRDRAGGPSRCAQLSSPLLGS